MKITKPSKKLFLLNRTSGLSSADEIEGAFYINKIIVESWNYDSHEKILINGFAYEWYKKGTNHRTENGKIFRDIGVEQFISIKINNVMEFVQKYGECIVSIKDGYNCIEIYDDYRE